VTQAADARTVAALTAARARVLDRVAAACRRARRDPQSVQLVAVSKTVDPGRLRAAVAAGLHVLGENRVQEAAAKVGDVPGATWHLVGPLQSNKVRRAVALFDVIETVDSVELGTRVGAAAAELGRAPKPVLLQVNVDRDPAKAGLDPDDLGASIDRLAGVEGIRIDGLMTVGRLVASAAEARGTFVALRSLSVDLREGGAGIGPALSMGMSDDFEVAVEEGATIVRVGRALFGERPTA
jgi:pyridoxal phosphate enzyme (YggS family)